MTAFAKFPEYWLSLLRYTTFKNFRFMCCQNLIGILCAGCHLYFLIGSLIQNVYNDRFSNVNNEFNVTNVKN